MNEILLSYINGNYSYARDEFWGSTKLQMRDVMLEAVGYFEDKTDHTLGDDALNRFIRVIFLP